MYLFESTWGGLLFEDGAREVAFLWLRILWWLALSFTVNQLLDFFLWEGVLKRDGALVIPVLLKQTASLFVHLLFAAGILHFVFQQPVTPLLATSGIVAIILGYSAQSTLSDVFGGLSLGLTNAFEKGDWIVVDEQLGRVVDINWRVVKLMTMYETELTIPNSVVAKSKIVIYARPNGSRGLFLYFHIEKDAPIELVKSSLYKAARDSDLILDTPDPFASVWEYTPHGITYFIYFFTRAPLEAVLRNQVYSGLWHGLQREGISVSRQKISVVDPLVKAPTPDPLEELKPLVNSNQIFLMMTDEETGILCRAAERMTVGFPETLIQQGQESNSLYIVVQGSLGVLIRNDNSSNEVVATLGTGSLFGEISLLTGEPCTATVRCDTQAVVYRIDREALRPLFKARPELVDRLSEMMAERIAQTDRAKEELAARSLDADRQQSMANRLANRMKELFSL